MSKNIAILGLGWLGLPLAKHLQQKGHSITGTTTKSEKLMGLLKSQIVIKIIKVSHNIVRGNWKDFISGNEVLIITLPPGKYGNHPEEFANQIEQIAKGCNPGQKVIFISSTSVYGNENAVVVETQKPNPTKEVGQFILEAEEVVSRYFGANASIIRFAGLIGPDRHPGRFIKSTTPLLNPNGKVNLIHLDDCIALITAIVEKESYGEIFNGCSDEHPIRSKFYTQAALTLNVEPPKFDPNTPPKGKIISNEKSKKVLDINYKYANPERLFMD